eukprot:jgi/Mesvir1/2322/Mv19349-RA.2
MEIFVPGRICLFGEHSDWAGGYRRINASIDRGHALIVGTNQGLHARVKPHPSKLIIRTGADQGGQCFEMDMDIAELRAEAEKGGFFSYAAGVAHQVRNHYRVRGLEVDIYRMDLPMKKGLSSSAAVTVLIARAFNRVYDLKMTVRGEMEYAYLGEITTPSRCGRMDQGCAYGPRPVLMTFDGDRVDVEEVSAGRDIHLVVVDLAASKDTKVILNRLNHCYPEPDDDLQRGVQEFLGPINAGILSRACAALAEGNARALGELMTEAQALFDKLVYPPLQPLVFGGKGVGSQGDGSAQFVARDAGCQQQLLHIVEKELGMHALPLTIHAGAGVRKAVVVAASTQAEAALFPASKVVPQCLFPVAGGDGTLKPVVVCLVEEALSAGVDQVAVVVPERQRHLFDDLFHAQPPLSQLHSMSAERLVQHTQLLELGAKVTVLGQPSDEGLGHAILCARAWVGKDPFLLILASNLPTPCASWQQGATCSKQLVAEFNRVGHSVLGLHRTSVKEASRATCVKGDLASSTGVAAVSIAEIVDRPDEAYLEAHMQVFGLRTVDGESSFLCTCGVSVLQPQVMSFLEESVQQNARVDGLLELTFGLERLRRHENVSGLIVAGKCWDLVSSGGYLRAVEAFRAMEQISHVQ